MLEWYAKQGYQGRHTENGLWLCLFTLLNYDELFCTEAAAAQHTAWSDFPLNLAALDLAEPLAAMEAWSAREVEARVRRAWAERKGLQLKYVDWGRWDLDFLAAVASRAGGAVLAAVFRHLLRAGRLDWFGGYPDLALYNPFSQHALFVEVKGPGDALSARQRAAIEVLQASGANVKVALVVETNK